MCGGRCRGHGPIRSQHVEQIGQCARHAPNRSNRSSGEDSMGKYKQWLHHQEIGRRLRDQINTLEQERARVQKMAPAHPTSLPDLDNPIVTALLSYTSSGNKLSNIDVIKAAMPALDSDPDQRRPAASAAASASGSSKSGAQRAPASAATPATASVTAPAENAGNEAVVASLLARAEQMPSDPMEQM